MLDFCNSKVTWGTHAKGAALITALTLTWVIGISGYEYPIHHKTNHTNKTQLLYHTTGDHITTQESKIPHP